MFDEGMQTVPDSQVRNSGSEVLRRVNLLDFQQARWLEEEPVRTEDALKMTGSTFMVKCSMKALEPTTYLPTIRALQGGQNLWVSEPKLLSEMPEILVCHPSPSGRTHPWCLWPSRGRSGRGRPQRAGR